ncbi:Coenzyme F420 hydrogenase/dehydrogenase, beta subunit C-terminal domain [Clostridium tertium]|uniref:Coenzyme F420 hydrogenase/dehydrogenase, beta subunit C-terminal domain n=1 Tax=Clostridium tertium TaxID=1559 RepID=UPI000DCFAF30|nr:Coenzyme F420 hydrogenase/dehydrogenase, beta subunit C-terminal domain [Clostridium tertium]
MLNNIEDKSNISCSGCGVCHKICPTKSIKINRQVNGFYSPDINEECIGCGMCKKVCYKFIDKINCNVISEAKSYLAYSLNNINRLNASSGGIGKELCTYAINNGYEICGVEYDYKNDCAKHIILNSSEDLEKIVGSKYIPSFTVDAFSKLDKNKKYLIIGTPCQIYGLSKLRQLKKLDNIILIDFFCHGTPSLNLWDKYLNMVRRKYNISNIKKINFRDKVVGWHKFSMRIEDIKGNIFLEKMDTDLFMRFFLSNVDLNNPCYGCELRFDKIYSDIRLGDFWGPKCANDEKGTSILLTNTELGENIFKSLNNIYSESITFKELKQSQYVPYLKIPNEKKVIQEKLKSDMKLEEIYEKYLIPIQRRKKIINYITYPIKKVKSLIKRCVK